ncbi:MULTISPECIES: cytochrome P450 family protein [Kitasatospora]|uniref:Cytochrome P450 n=1 Tax=Kitasatospora cathayae TaxID=3004092 RepID=A0ABY7Q4G0_9ACTN|nr:cytochrome P450 [Kitasatospora sp. HUAS 3-15]WBP87588.1 cytochrome P450 [Kitasatospora sp. HUAS 3-15]
MELPGGVVVWAITHHDALQELLADPRVGKDPALWTTFREGRLPHGWPLLNFVAVPGMITADGEDHKRLRGLVSQAFTPRRTAALAPAVEARTAALLDRMAELEGAFDLREHFAYPLPMQVIGELLGLAEEQQDRLHALSDVLVSSSATPEAALAAQRDLNALLASVVAAKRAEPGDDLTTDLIAAREAGHRLDQQRLSEAELVGTLLLMLVAGHQTTLNLITNAVRALLAHPDQLRLVLDGAQPWSAVVEETLRYDSPVGQFPLRYAIEDIAVGEVVIRRGEAMLASYAAAGRDDGHYPDADRFDLTRQPARHLSLGHGPHFCLGSGLARLEAEAALRQLFTRFPGLALAEGERPEPIGSFVSNSVRTLRVTV